MKGLHKRTVNPNKDVMSWMKEDEVAKGRKEEIRATTRIILHLIDYMDRNQMSQTDLARELGVSPQYINKLLRGQDKSLKIETAVEYGKKLGIKLVEVPETVNDEDMLYTVMGESACVVRPTMGFHERVVSLFTIDVIKPNKKITWNQQSSRLATV